MPLQTGQVLNNRYRVVRQLGQGGFGTVYRVWDLDMGAPCALKENLDLSPSSRARFDREARLLFTLRHAGLPRVYDLFEVSGSGQYLVMDFIEGEDLQSMLARLGHPVDPQQAVDWLCQVCEALIYLHSQNPPVIHRDIKPANIKVTPNNQAVLVDFGIAREYDPSQPVTQAARPVTPGYSPPEQYGAQPTDQRSDIYALGATAYTLLTGQVPPSAADLTAGKAALPAPPASLNPNLSPGLSEAVMRAMRLNISERFRSVEDFKDTLNNLPQLTTQPPSGGVESLSSVLKKLFSGRRWVQPAAAMLILSLVAVLYFTVLSPMIENQSEIRLPSGVQPVDDSESVEIAGGEATRSGTLSSSEVDAREKNNPQFVERARWGKGTPIDAAWSTNGRWLYIGSTLGLHVYDADSLNEEDFIETDSSIYRLLISPDGKTLAVALSGKTIQLWNAQKLKFLHEFVYTKYPLGKIEFSPNSAMLAYFDQDAIKLVDVQGGSLIQLLEVSTNDRGGLAFSPDGSLLAYFNGSSIQLLDVYNGSISQTLQGTAERIHNLAFSPDGRRLVSLSVYGEIQAWDLADGSLLYSQPGLGDPDIYAGNLVFSADGSLLAVANAGNNIQILDPGDGSLVRTLVGHEQTVGTIAFVQNEKTLLSHARYWAVYWWEANTGDLLYTLAGTNFYWPLFTFSPDGKIPIRANEVIEIRDGSNGGLLSQIEDFSPSYWKFSPSPDGSHLAAWNSINRLDLLDLESGEVKQTATLDLENTLTRLNQCTHSPDGDWLVCSFSDGSLQVWDVKSWDKLLDIESGSEEISNCVFSPDGTRIICGDDLGLLRAWKSQDGQLLRTIEAHSDEIGMLLTAPDGNYLASASRSTIRLWEPETLEMLLEIEETDWVNCLALSPDSSTIAAGREDYLVNLWNISDGTLLRTLEGHVEEVFSLAFSADGSLIASGDSEGMIYLWGGSDGALLSHFPAHHGTVTSLAFTPDGTGLISAGSDGTIRVWEIPIQW